MKELTHAQVQKSRRRESKKNAIAQHKAFKRNNPHVHEQERNTIIGKLVDLVVKTKYPLFQCRLIVA